MIQTTDTMLAGASVRRRLALPAQRGAPAARHPAFPTARRAGATAGRQPPAVAARCATGSAIPPELHGDDASRPTPVDLHPDVLASIYAPLFADTTTEAICEEAQRRNVPVTPVLSPARAARQRAAAPPRHVRRHRRSTAAPGVCPSGYWEFDDQRVGFRRPAATLGADTDAVRGARTRARRRSPSRASHVRPRAARAELPLAGVRVLEFTQLMAGPETGKLLRDHGADVIRVESRAFPDQSRVFGGAANMSSQFVSINRGKRSLGVDLTHRGGPPPRARPRRR